MGSLSSEQTFLSSICMNINYFHYPSAYLKSLETLTFENNQQLHTKMALCYTPCCKQEHNFGRKESKLEVIGDGDIFLDSFNTSTHF